jgi:hypothetical protein
MRNNPDSSISGTSVAADPKIGALASRQGGFVTRGQLLDCGLKRGAIDRRLEAGRLIHAYYGVYAVGHLPKLPFDRARGALLAMGPGAVLDGASAAALWGVTNTWPGIVEVVSPTDRGPKGIKVRRCTRLSRGDIRIVDGLRVISPALTVLQIAPKLSEDQLTRAIDTLRLRRNLTIRQLEIVLQRFPRSKGARALRAILPQLQAEPTRSGLERSWPAFAAKFDLPPYVMNHHVLTYRVDILFTPNRLIVELDGPQHEHPWGASDDKHQDAEILAETGIPTVRITYRAFEAKPEQQARLISQVLVSRPA